MYTEASGRQLASVRCAWTERSIQTRHDHDQTCGRRDDPDPIDRSPISGQAEDHADTHDPQSRRG